MADEKIRLVLSTDGVQDIKALEQRFEELAQAMGLSDYAFENVTDKAEKTKKKVQELDGSLDEATGKKSSGGRGISGFAYAMQDLSQGGWPAILNNIQQLAAGVGLGAGVAGAAQLAAVAVVSFRDELDKLIYKTKDFPKTLGEVTTSLQKETTAVENLRKEYDELLKSEELTITKRTRLRTVTEELSDAEKRLTDEKAAMAALNDADQSVGEEEKVKVDSQKQSFKESIVDTGKLRGLKQELLRSELEKNPEITKEDIREEMFGVMAQEAGTTIKEAKAQYYGAGQNLSPAALFQSQQNTEKKYGEEARQRIQTRRGESAKERVGRILDAFKNAKTQDELDKAFQELAQISPQRANELRDYHQQRIESEALDKEVDDSSEKMKEQRTVREKKAAAQTQSFGRMGRMLATGQRVEEAAEKKAGRDDKADERLAEREEKKRVEIRDKAMERMGVTPEGLAVQRQNAGAGTSRAAQVARQNTGQQQEQALLARFKNDGMTAEQAKKTTEEIKNIGADIVRTMVRTGEMDLTMFKQLQLTARGQEMSRQRAMQEMQAGIRKPGFQGGMRSN